MGSFVGAMLESSEQPPHNFVFASNILSTFVEFMLKRMLKPFKQALIHHVCGEHEWEHGECSHGQLTEAEEGKEILAKDSKAAEELCKIIYDAEWLKSLQYYEI